MLLIKPLAKVDLVATVNALNSSDVHGFIAHSALVRLRGFAGQVGHGRGVEDGLVPEWVAREDACFNEAFGLGCYGEGGQLCSLCAAHGLPAGAVSKLGLVLVFFGSGFSSPIRAPERQVNIYKSMAAESKYFPDAADGIEDMNLPAAELQTITALNCSTCLCLA